jgi:hypothetical protein
MGKVQPDTSLDVRPRQLGEDLDGPESDDQHESSWQCATWMGTYDASISSTWETRRQRVSEQR